MSTDASEEVKNPRRFEFGKNWKSFLATLEEDRIRVAENSILEMLEVDSLEGERFLDVGSGSGLFSLVARRLRATVHSFDYDHFSVECTKELRSKFFANDPEWTIEQGSVLDEGFLKALGTFDIVYSWGVLHHTGHLWKALDNVATLVKTGGTLFIAIYNDEGRSSKFWWRVKRLYCSSSIGQWLVLGIFVPYFFLRVLAMSVLRRENRFSAYKANRGMSIVHDWIDWLGGFPFEVAKVEKIFRLYKDKGFTLANLKTGGINEFVFVKK
jgi:2-polyprenyl-6-hydroxyphenyl methylase/3-demethylubiquinone-9 3-methyltransferase